METIRDIEYPFVSIIIPVKNEEKYIGKCLDSIFACDYPIEFYEVIVVDNGSSDMSVEIAKQKGAKIFIKPGLPISGLRNVGARESIGEIIVFLDADCLVSSQWIKSAIFIFKQNRNIIACGSSPIFENQTWVQRTWEFSITSNKEINIVSWLPSMNLFVKKKYFIKVKGFDETLSTCEDVDFCYRLKNYGEILSCKNTMIMHMGEPKTLKEFYFRELWRGQSNFRGVLRHGVVLNEIPTLIMPIYIICILGLAIFSVLFNHYLILLYSLFFFILPAILLAFQRSFIKKKYGYFFKLILLYLIYFIARTIAIFIKFKHRSTKIKL